MKKIGGVFAFKVKDGPNGQEAMWFVDVKNGNGCVHNDTGKGTYAAHYSERQVNMEGLLTCFSCFIK